MQWKRNTYKRPEQKRWYAGETISLGIGQGYNHFTMLQLAYATAMLANRGVQHQPHLGLGRIDAVTRQYHALPQPPGLSLGYKPENIEAVREATRSRHGRRHRTGHFCRRTVHLGWQNRHRPGRDHRPKERYNAAKLAERQRDHSLYIAYAPADQPEIALAVIVENAGFGATAATPIARRVFDYWLLGHYPSEQDLAASRQGLARTPIGTPRRAADMLNHYERISVPGLSPRAIPWVPPAAAAKAPPAPAPEEAAQDGAGGAAED